MRTDIPLADQLVQVGHACLAAGWQFAPPAGACHLVVLAVASEAQLRAVVDQVQLAGIRCALFEEPDDALGVTAACSAPICGAARRCFRRLPLWCAPAELVRARGPPASLAEGETRTPHLDFGCPEPEFCAAIHGCHGAATNRQGR